MRKRPGAIGIDVNPKSDADCIHDLNVFPYPFEDNAFDEIYVDNVIEHLNDVIRVMEELHRISKHQARVKINVPYFRARWAFLDPTHRHFFTLESFAYFDPGHAYHQLFPYSPATFVVEKAVLNEKFHCSGLGGVLGAAVKYFSNRQPLFYEARLSHWWPLDEISFYLRVAKKQP